MHLVLKTKERYLASLTPEELTAISNALNEVCNGIEIADTEFQTRLGRPRSEITKILKQLDLAFAATNAQSSDVTDAWSDGGSVQVRAISVFGDPVDMSAEEAQSFAKLITSCAHEADAA